MAQLGQDSGGHTSDQVRGPSLGIGLSLTSAVPSPAPIGDGLDQHDGPADLKDNLPQNLGPAEGDLLSSRTLQLNKQILPQVQSWDSLEEEKETKALICQFRGPYPEQQDVVTVKKLDLASRKPADSVGTLMDDAWQVVSDGCLRHVPFNDESCASAAAIVYANGEIDVRNAGRTNVFCLTLDESGYVVSFERLQNKIVKKADKTVLPAFGGATLAERSPADKMSFSLAKAHSANFESFLLVISGGGFRLSDEHIRSIFEKHRKPEGGTLENLIQALIAKGIKEGESESNISALLVPLMANESFVAVVADGEGPKGRELAMYCAIHLRNQIQLRLAKTQAQPSATMTLNLGEDKSDVMEGNQSFRGTRKFVYRHPNAHTGLARTDVTDLQITTDLKILVSDLFEESEINGVRNKLAGDFIFRVRHCEMIIANVSELFQRAGDAEAKGAQSSPTCIRKTYQGTLSSNLHSEQIIFAQIELVTFVNRELAPGVKPKLELQACFSLIWNKGFKNLPFTPPRRNEVLSSQERIGGFVLTNLLDAIKGEMENAYRAHVQKENGYAITDEMKGLADWLVPLTQPQKKELWEAALRQLKTPVAVTKYIKNDKHLEAYIHLHSYLFEALALVTDTFPPGNELFLQKLTEYLNNRLWLSNNQRILFVVELKLILDAILNPVVGGGCCTPCCCCPNCFAVAKISDVNQLKRLLDKEQDFLLFWVANRSINTPIPGQLDARGNFVAATESVNIIMQCLRCFCSPFSSQPGRAVTLQAIQSRIASSRRAPPTLEEQEDSVSREREVLGNFTPVVGITGLSGSQAGPAGGAEQKRDTSLLIQYIRFAAGGGEAQCQEMLKDNYEKLVNEIRAMLIAPKDELVIKQIRAFVRDPILAGFLVDNHMARNRLVAILKEKGPKDLLKVLSDTIESASESQPGVVSLSTFGMY